MTDARVQSKMESHGQQQRSESEMFENNRGHL